MKRTALRERVFVSYSHRDRKHLDRLRVHRRPLERSGVIDLWSDIDIQAGEMWKAEIARAIDRARVAILLVSADFLASAFIAESELPPLLRAAESDGVTILPVIVGASRFTKIPELSMFQSVNDPTRPVALLPVAERERIWVRVADSVEATLQNRGSEDGWTVANEKLVGERLHELVNTTDGFLIVSAGDYYVQFIVEGDSLVMEGVSNEFLPEGVQLPEAKELRMRQLGFQGPDKGRPNYHRTVNLRDAADNADRLAALAVKVMGEVYEVSRAAKLTAELTPEG